MRQQDDACKVIQQWWRRRCTCQATSVELCWLGASGVVLLHGRDTPFPCLKIVNVFRMMEQLLASDNCNLLGTPLHPRSIDLIVTKGFSSPHFRLYACNKYPLEVYGLHLPPPRTPRLRGAYLRKASVMLIDRQQCLQRDRDLKRMFEWAIVMAEHMSDLMLHYARHGELTDFKTALKCYCAQGTLEETLHIIAVLVTDFSVWCDQFMPQFTAFLDRVHDRAFDPNLSRAADATDGLFFHGFFAFIMRSVCCAAEDKPSPHSPYALRACLMQLRMVERHLRSDVQYGPELDWHLAGCANAVTVAQQLA